MKLNKIYKLAQICSKIGSGATPKGGKESYLGGNTSLIRSQNVIDFGFLYNGLALINDEQAHGLDNVTVMTGDVLLNITGDSVARCCKVPSNILPARVNQHVAIIRGDNNIVISDYILSYLQYKKPYLLSLSQGGATRNALTKKMIEDIKIPLPSISEQRHIIDLLSSIDNKIELNRRINDNLEQQTQAWLNELLDRYADSTTVLIHEIAEINPKRNLSKGTSAKCIEMANLPTIGSFPNGWIEKEYNGGMKFRNGDTLIARITPCLENGKTAFINFLDKDEIAYGSTEYIVISAKNNYSSSFFYFLARNHDFVDYAVKNMNGSSGRQRVSGDTIGKYRIPVIPREELESFMSHAEITLKTIKDNSLQNMRLSMIRDALLPKLMSGELKVNDLNR